MFVVRKRLRLTSAVGVSDRCDLIAEASRRNGPFRAPGDLARVAGFGPSRVRGLAGRVWTGG